MIKNKNIDNINFDGKVIYFMHIPKTAGSSINSKQIIHLGHNFNVDYSYRIPAKLGGYHDYNADLWEKYKFNNPNNIKITIIRNPFDLLCSYYHHGEKLKENNEYCHSGWGSVNYTHQFKSFEEFIDAYCDENFKWHVPLLKQFLFSQLFDENHNCIPDIIIKYEFLDKAVKIMNTKLTHKINLSHSNSSVNKKNKNYTNFYNNEMKKKIEKKCHRELKIFNYDFFGSTNQEPLIINPSIKYDIKKDLIYLDN